MVAFNTLHGSSPFKGYYLTIIFIDFYRETKYCAYANENIGSYS